MTPYKQAGFLRDDNGALIFSDGPAVSEQGGYPVDADGALVVEGFGLGGTGLTVNPYTAGAYPPRPATDGPVLWWGPTVPVAGMFNGDLFVTKT